LHTESLLAPVTFYLVDAAFTHFRPFGCDLIPPYPSLQIFIFSLTVNNHIPINSIPAPVCFCIINLSILQMGDRAGV
jgi:hypothetical protein